eukprot:TRINITY_DN148_c0_g1_i8.p2 TRINITY_DN148_c0_g1~~TRINITY_DN148_c0_g1_i8.p2  ORF type:complete len:131 (+),score=17.52 TRINITY_DN148_c0_g1_i8:187-579(+)
MLDENVAEQAQHRHEVARHEQVVAQVVARHVELVHAVGQRGAEQLERVGGGCARSVTGRRNVRAPATRPAGKLSCRWKNRSPNCRWKLAQRPSRRPASRPCFRTRRLSYTPSGSAAQSSLSEWAAGVRGV